MFEPIVCAPGYYCPAGGQQQLLCPAAHYCPLGSFEPIRCDSISVCPVGIARQFSLTGLAVLVIIDLALVATMIGPSVWSYWCAWRKSRSLSRLQVPVLDTEQKAAERDVTINESLESPDINAGHLQRFVRSLAKCIGEDDVGLQISFDQLSFQLKKSEKVILNGVSGMVERGSLLAVMGASGAGKCKYLLSWHLAIQMSICLMNSKATLVRILMGKLKETSGSIFINGVSAGISE